MQRFFTRLNENGFIFVSEVDQFFCEYDKKFLPDRYVKGKCPYCGAEDQYSDGCDNCGRTLQPGQILSPHCAICGRPPAMRKSTHYFFKLSAFSKKLEEWLRENEALQPDAKNYVLNWIKDGLQDWDITRDIAWGVPDPAQGGRGQGPLRLVRQPSLLHHRGPEGRGEERGDGRKVLERLEDLPLHREGHRLPPLPVPPQHEDGRRGVQAPRPDPDQGTSAPAGEEDIEEQALDDHGQGLPGALPARLPEVLSDQDSPLQPGGRQLRAGRSSRTRSTTSWSPASETSSTGPWSS